MAEIELIDVGKRYENGFAAVHDANLRIADGEFVVLVGPSGCGKSTTLRMIAGLETVSQGEIRIGGQRVNEREPGDRDIAMVFQNYALYPHMTVRQNLSFGLRMRKTPRDEIQRRVEHAARILSIESLLDRRPRQLSGGQRQRVALGRAIVRQPAAFLFDEPLSNLDAKLRVQMRTEITRLHQQLRTTTVYVTHDQVEAMTLGQRIVVMDRGRIQQVAPPMEIYNRPVNRFVAGFIGSPAMNFVPGRIEGGRFRGGRIEFALPAPIEDQQVVLGFRPEHLTLEGDQPPLFEAVPEVVERMGHETFLYFGDGADTVVARLRGDIAVDASHPLAIHLPPAQSHLFRADATGLRIESGE